MLRRRAEDKRERTTPQALETVLNSFHVYDCLSSVASDNHAVALAKDLRVFCLSGGFRLTKWTRNSRVLLLLILEEEKATEVKHLDFNNSQLPVERSLGIQWGKDSDTFKFMIEVKEKPSTRRGLLSIVSSP